MITLNTTNTQVDISDLSNLFPLIDQLQTKEMSGWLNLPEDRDKVIESIKEFVQERGNQFETILACGIGGSSLGTITIHNALFPFDQKLHILDNLDSNKIKHIIDTINPQKTLIIIISKSGETLEPMTQYLLLKQHFCKSASGGGQELYKSNFIHITDPKKGYLHELTEKDKITAFPIPDEVGGRFSVLTAIGLLPLALLGGDPQALLNGAADMKKKCLEKSNDNPALQLAYIIHQLNKPILSIMSYSDQLFSLTNWYQQLLAESIGKSTKIGITPLPLKGATDQHSVLQLLQEGPNDKITFFLDVEKPTQDIKIEKIDDEKFSYINGKTIHQLLRTELKGTSSALAEDGRPNLTINVTEISEYTLGELFFLLEMQVALLGELYQINAFNQPGVEKSKIITKQLLQR